MRAYAQRATGALDRQIVQKVPASLEQILEFEFGSLPRVDYRDGTSEPAHRIALVGAHSRPNATLTLGAGVESFAIFLRPAALQHMLGIPTCHLTDRSCPAVDALGYRIEVLWATLAQAPSFESRVRSAESYLAQMLQIVEPTAIAKVAWGTFRDHGQIAVSEMARQVSLSVRQFERKFEQEMGMSPKLFARIARFQFALDAKISHPGRSWLDVAHNLGYSDQMHLVRDFKSLGGDSPTDLLANLGDTRPPALAESSV